MRSLQEIKLLRNKFHLTQKQLAQHAGVSQSLIAKIEAGRLDPTFSKAQAIWQALETLREKNELKAKDVMKKEVITISAQGKIADAITTMKKHSISQLPVIRQGKVCGLLTENSLLKSTTEAPQAIHSLTAAEVMEEIPPIIAEQTGRKTLHYLLQEHAIVLVARQGEIQGIVSRSDLLRA